MKPAMKARVASQEQITLTRELEILMMVLMMVNVLGVTCVHWSEVARQLRLRVSMARIYPGAGYGISFRSSHHHNANLIFNKFNKFIYFVKPKFKSQSEQPLSPDS